jgi:Aldehyde:ferredoxin oxidoreductase
MGADHTCGNALPNPNLPEYDPSSAEGQAQMSQFLQAFFAAVDTLGICLFAAWPALDNPTLQRALANAAAAVTGHQANDDYMIALGTEVVKSERAFNRAAGFTAADDRLPSFMVNEALPPSGNRFDVSDADLDSVFAD